MWPENRRWIVLSFLEDRKEWCKQYWAAWGELSIYGSPRFYLVADDRLIFTDAGEENWKYRVRPEITKLVGA